MSSSAEGNTNYIFYPAASTETYQHGGVNMIVDEDITGLDALTKSQEFDLQWNFFAESGKWWQIIIEPGSVLYPNMFQLWKVDIPTQSYQATMFSIGDWAQQILKKGSITTLYWGARRFASALPILQSAFLSIRNPAGISNQWQINFSDLLPSPDDLILDLITDRTQPGACMSVFSITGSDGGSLFTAATGKGRLIYEGMQLDPTDALGAQTAESSNFKYTPPLPDQFGNFIQTFHL
jgi:hypothetical protein